MLLYRLTILSPNDAAEDLQDLQAPPGNREVLLEDFMKPLGLSQYRLAKDICVTPIRISQIVNGKRAITIDTALRPARYFGITPEVWLRLQVRYALEAAGREMKDRIRREVKVLRQPVV